MAGAIDDAGRPHEAKWITSIAGAVPALFHSGRDSSFEVEYTSVCTSSRNGKAVNTLDRVLVINTGSTSTKIAIFHGREPIYSESVRHPAEELSQFPQVPDQLEYRKAAVLARLERAGQDPGALDAVVSRGGAPAPMPGGVYAISRAMLQDLAERPATEHAANLSPPIAFAIAESLGVPAFFVDPITVDEFEPLARLSGLPEAPRNSRLHALSIRSTARKVAEKLRRDLGDINVIVAHLGSGISICPVKAGLMVDANGADDEGPFSPERAGTLPMADLVSLCFAGRYTQREMLKKITRQAGLMAHLGTADAREVERTIQAGDLHALRVAQAMAYQIAKEIGAMATVVSGKVDAIALTGGLAAWGRLVDDVTARCSFIAPIMVFPGENEMEALAWGAIRVLAGEEEAREYVAASAP